MPVENTTANRGYPLPATTNDLSFDVLRLLATIAAIDTDMATALTPGAVYASLDSPTFVGTPEAPTQLAGDASTKLATTAFVAAAVAALVQSAPGLLDTLDELAAALGDDPNFAATMLAALADKASLAQLGSKADTSAMDTALALLLPLAGGTMLGPINMGGYAITNAAGGIDLVGSVVSFAMATPPTGWLKANGAAISRTTYSDLFTAIGTVFGVGDGSTTFDLPDVRGEFLRGWDDGRGVDSGRVFGSYQGDTFEAHTHSIVTGNVGGGSRLIGIYAGSGASKTTASTGGSETRPRSLAVLTCIKY